MTCEHHMGTSGNER